MRLRQRRRRPCAVLLVDDEQAILVSLRDSLRDAAMEVTTAASGQEALRLLGDRSFDVVVSDVRMPGLSGMELLARMRRDGLGTPVILTTAYATVSQAVEAMRMGAYHYVTKPFPDEKVVRLVQKAWSPVSLRAEVLRASLEGRLLHDAVEEFERSFITFAVREFGGTRAKLADRLGISRKSLWQKLRKYGLVPGRSQAGA